MSQTWRARRFAPPSREKIKRTNGAKRDWAELHARLAELYKITTESGANRLRAMLKQVVPEYEPVNGFARHSEMEETVAYLKKAAGRN